MVSRAVCFQLQDSRVEDQKTGPTQLAFLRFASPLQRIVQGNMAIAHDWPFA